MRYMFDQLKSQITARLPDNSTGQITPAVLRGVLIDFVDSVQGAFVTLVRSDTQTVNLTATLAPVAGLFAEITESAPDEIAADLPSQSATVLIDCAVEFSLSVVITGPVAERVAIGLTIDGVPYEFFQAEQTLPDLNAPVTLTASGFARLTAGQVLHCGLASLGGPQVVTIGPASMLVRLLPQRN